MLDISDNITDFVEIPDCFSGLPKKHYPLVITFWKFLLMLDGTIGNSFFDKFYVESGVSVEKGVSKSHALQAYIRGKEVTYERFMGSYWPHFNIQLTKKLDASTVFTQIISHIKGGFQRGMVSDGKLGRKQYTKLSEKRVSSLSSETREVIYDIFILYENQKRIKKEFDLSDFVMDLHCRLIRDGYIGDKVDFVYIDEVQDLTLRQIALFKHVCKNFKEGFIFSGDTAQTIARGIDFRFQDIRSLFYSEFLSELKSENQAKKQDKEIQTKDMFQLNQNFRTHAGVLKLAQSIVDLLHNFFPLSVDKLIPETSLIYGEAPVLLECDNDKNAIITIFGCSGTGGYCENGFGSEQVILVRDDSSKKQVLDLVGNQALVLTILECKGLEFQDVLLYNFFGESLFNKWRVVYEYMKNKEILDPSANRTFPSFDGAKHNLLCSELKQLYVAITRTRQRLWICESTDEYSKPMFDYWKSLCLVQVRHLDSSLAQDMRATSSPEEWKLRGIKLFNEGNYGMATMCFERAGDEYREKWARAAGLYATADLIISTNYEMGENTLKRAADIYESIGKSETAAMCYIKLKDFRKAGMIYLEKCGISRLEDAGDCLSMAECWSLAADVYSKAKCFSKCLSICSKAKLFDEGLQFLKNWKEDPYMDEKRYQELGELEMSFLESCALHFYEQGNHKNMMKFVKAFNSLDLIRSFLKSNGLLDELLLLEVEMGNYVEAATVSKIKGDILQEVEMLEKACHFQEATKLILFDVVVNSLWAPGSKGWPLRTSSRNDELLMKAKQLAGQKSDTDSFYRSVCSEVYILSSSSKNLMDFSRHLSEAIRCQNVRLEVFIERSILDFHVKSEPSKYIWVTEPVSDVKTHTNELLSQNKFSLETLMHIWNLLKATLLEVLLYIGFRSFESAFESDQIYKDFCYEYFGVRKEDNQDKYFVINLEACWIEKIRLSLPQDKKWINVKQFMLCAQEYWNMELQSLSMIVLEKLESLYNFSLRNEVTPYWTGRLLISIYEVARFHSERKSMPNGIDYKLDKFFSLCRRCFPDIVFPLDWKSGISECMITLLENGTARGLLEHCLLENLRPRNDILTHGQVCRMVTFILLTGELTVEVFNRINGCLDQMPTWKIFMKELKTFLESGFGRIRLICKFQEALGSTFLADWRTELDYVSPHCFIRLIDCLMSFTSSCQGFKGYFFSTRSSFFEMLKCQASKGYISGCFTAPDAQFRNSIDRVLDSIIDMIQRLIFDKRGVLHWIEKSSLPNSYYLLFVLKMMILLCLGYLNIGCDMSRIQKRLFSSHIFEDLPKPFSAKLSQAISYKKHDRVKFLKVLDDVLHEVGDPLVVICSQDCYSQFLNLNACVISSEKMKCRENAFSMLFPNKAVFQHQESLEVPQENLRNPMPSETSSFINSQENDSANIDSKIAAELQNLTVQTRNADTDTNTEKNYTGILVKCHDTNCSRCITVSAKVEMVDRSPLISAAIEMVKQKQILNSGDFAVNLDLENVNQVLQASITWIEQNCRGNLLRELKPVLDEFKLLTASNKGIEVLYTKWHPWLLVLTDKKATAEFLSYLTNIKETPSTEEITTSQTAENIDEEIDQDDGEAKEETVGAGVDNQSTNQKKNEAKKPRKRAKGKGKKK